MYCGTTIDYDHAYMSTPTCSAVFVHDRAQGGRSLRHVRIGATRRCRCERTPNAQRENVFVHGKCKAGDFKRTSRNLTLHFAHTQKSMIKLHKPSYDTKKETQK